MIRVIHPDIEYTIKVQVYDNGEPTAYLMKDGVMDSKAIHAADMENLLLNINLIIEDREYIRLKEK